MELFIRLTIVLFALVLFGIAAVLFFEGSAATAATAMGFVLFFVFILTVSHYKRIKGLGFEAEMWGEKQEQAAHLIDRLELLSRPSSEHIALVASKSGLSNLQIMQVTESMRSILAETKTSELEREKVLSPLFQRSISNSSMTPIVSFNWLCRME